MTTDPRLAALAEALDAVDVRSGYRLSRMSPPMGPTTLAAAILAALPPDWCGHDAASLATHGWHAVESAEIARLRLALNAAVQGEKAADSEITRLRDLAKTQHQLLIDLRGLNWAEQIDVDGKPYCPSGYAQRYHAIGQCDCAEIARLRAIEEAGRLAAREPFWCNWGAGNAALDALRAALGEKP